ncbi:MAG: ribonuclease HI [Deltaproteobacteria bacterium]|nr:ribonuclease HI [Deltaproteobacteria bacterium]
MEQDQDNIIVYTDGACSKNPGPAGIGAVLIWKDHIKEISEYIGKATNNIAELKAILKALTSIKNKNLPVRLYTDSTYAIGVLSGWKIHANKTLIKEIKKEMKRFSSLSIRKVEGHSGQPENERADKLAKDAIKGHLNIL